MHLVLEEAKERKYCHFNGNIGRSVRPLVYPSNFHFQQQVLDLSVDLHGYRRKRLLICDDTSLVSVLRFPAKKSPGCRACSFNDHNKGLHLLFEKCFQLRLMSIMQKHWRRFSWFILRKQPGSTGYLEEPGNFLKIKRMKIYTINSLQICIKYTTRVHSCMLVIEFDCDTTVFSLKIQFILLLNCILYINIS